MITKIASCYIGAGVIYMAWCFLRKRDEKFIADADTKWADIKRMLQAIPDSQKTVVGAILAVTTTTYLVWCVLTWPVSIFRKVKKKWQQ